MALVALSVVEQRLDAVRAVLAGARVSDVAASVGVSRQSLHSWIGRYLVEGIAGLADRSRRPHSCPHQASGQVEVGVVELRRAHPSWGAKRIRMELLRRGESGEAVVSERTVNRILSRHGLLTPRPRKRARDSYRRWQRQASMQLWQIDIVGGVMIVDTTTGELREAKVVTGVDDHSRFNVIAKVVERATGRAVCLALAEALIRFGVPRYRTISGASRSSSGGGYLGNSFRMSQPSPRCVRCSRPSMRPARRWQGSPGACLPMTLRISSGAYATFAGSCWRVRLLRSTRDGEWT